MTSIDSGSRFLRFEDSCSRDAVVCYVALIRSQIDSEVLVPEAAGRLPCDIRESHHNHDVSVRHYGQNIEGRRIACYIHPTKMACDRVEYSNCESGWLFVV